MAVGAASLVTGVALGFEARSDYHSAFDSGHCLDASAAHPVCDATGYSQTSRAHALGDAGTLIGVGGLTLVGAGAFMYFTAPRLGATTVTPVVDRQGAGLVLGGRF